MNSFVRKSLLAVVPIASALAGSGVLANADSITVQPGDTLSGIAEAHSTSIDELVRLNNIKNPHLIFAGSTMTISDKMPTNAPSEPSQATATSAETYVVQPGDTLTKIASQFATTVANLVSINNISDANMISVGQTIQLHAAVNTTNETNMTATQTQTTDVQPAQTQVTENPAPVADNTAATQATTPTTTESATPAATEDPATPAAPVTQAAPTTPTTPAAQSNGGNWLDVANSLIGTPYVWGGKTPQTGFDCSGFVAWVLNHSGRTTNFPSYTIAEERLVQHISVDEAQPGDLLFWGNPGSTYHVAIYLGDGKFISAPEPGDHVRVQNLSRGWRPSFAGRL